MKVLHSLSLALCLLVATAAWADGGGHDANRHRGEPTWVPATEYVFHHGNNPLSPWTALAHSPVRPANSANAPAPPESAENELARAIRLPVRMVAHYAATTLAFLAQLCAHAIFGLSDD